MLKNSKISDYKIKKILKCFCEDLPSIKTARILEINRNTTDRYYNIFREKIAQFSLSEQAEFGEFELDESYFGAKRIRGKRGRGAAGKTPVFGLLKREGKVFVSIVKSCSREELLPIIKGKILKGSTIHTDGWKAYDGLIVNGYDHYRVYHSHDEFVRGKSHVNGIESFWSFAKRRMAKFNGIASEKFNLYLKECEFRWNYKSENIYDKMLKILKNF
jgi:transposase